MSDEQNPEAGSQKPEAERRTPVTADAFIDALMEAGIIPVDAMVREVTIYARYGHELEVDVVTLGDERLLRVAGNTWLRAALGKPGA